MWDSHVSDWTITKRTPYKKDVLKMVPEKIAPFVIMFEQIEVAAHRKGVDGFDIGPAFDNNWYAHIKKN